MRDNTVIWFDSPEHYAEYLNAIPRQYTEHTTVASLGNYEQCLNKLIQGDRTGLDKAQAIIDKMGDQQIFSLMTPTLVSDVVGFVPNVGNALMGVPQDMYNIEYIEEESVTSPIRVFVETTVSAALSVDELVNRGVACLALTLALSMVRPVELYAASFGVGYGRGDWDSPPNGAIVRIPTTPIDLDRAVYMLCNPGYARMLAFAAMRYQANWPRHSGIPFPRNCRDICKCEPQDILIQGGHIEDTLMLKDPIKWVKNMIAQHGGQKDE